MQLVTQPVKNFTLGGQKGRLRNNEHLSHLSFLVGFNCSLWSSLNLWSVSLITFLGKLLEKFSLDKSHYSSLKLGCKKRCS